MMRQTLLVGLSATALFLRLSLAQDEQGYTIPFQPFQLLFSTDDTLAVPDTMGREVYRDATKQQLQKCLQEDFPSFLDLSIFTAIKSPKANLYQDQTQIAVYGFGVFTREDTEKDVLANRLVECFVEDEEDSYLQSLKNAGWTDVVGVQVMDIDGVIYEESLANDKSEPSSSSSSSSSSSTNEKEATPDESGASTYEDKEELALEDESDEDVETDEADRDVVVSPVVSAASEETGADDSDVWGKAVAFFKSLWGIVAAAAVGTVLLIGALLGARRRRARRQAEEIRIATLSELERQAPPEHMFDDESTADVVEISVKKPAPRDSSGVEVFYDQPSTCRWPWK